MENLIYTVRSLNNPIPPSIDAQFNNKERAAGFYTSRLALQESLHKLTLKNWPLEHLAISHHHNLTQEPNILVSLAHTQTLGAAVVAWNYNTQSIGIDIEYRDRTIPCGTSKFFIHKNDDIALLNDLLQTWSMKEAAFKAIYSLLTWANKKINIHLTNIWIRNNIFGVDHETSIKGQLNIRENIINDKKVLVALAWINNLSTK